MHTKRILSLLTVASAPLLASPAMAQMYPGEGVIVNPAAMPGPLLAPGQPYPGIHLHRPYHHRHHVAVAKATAPAADTTTASTDMAASSAAPLDTPAAPPPKSRRSRHAATATAGVDPSASGLGFTFGEDDPSASAPAAANTKTASNTAAPAKAGKPEASNEGLAKRGSILFEHNSTDPQASQMDGIKLLAGDLNSALEAGATQIQLQAFGGALNDKSSDARRIALKRALAIRQLLIDNGVPASKVITKAMGGATEGEPDRVDIYVRA